MLCFCMCESGQSTTPEWKIPLQQKQDEQLQTATTHPVTKPTCQVKETQTNRLTPVAILKEAKETQTNRLTPVTFPREVKETQTSKPTPVTFFWSKESHSNKSSPLRRGGTKLRNRLEVLCHNQETQTAKLTPLKQLSSLYRQLEEYEMTKTPHGDCVIFSNRFDVAVKAANSDYQLKQRSGTEKDEQVLKETFEFLKFTVTVYTDLSAAQMIETLKSYASQKEQEEKNCFVCCILSHGYEGGVYGNDGNTIDTKSIKGIFSGDSCPSLLMKPKLFFIQACQGKTDSGFGRVASDGAMSPFVLPPCMTENGGYDLSWNEDEENIAADADILFFMAATPGMTSWRDVGSGSWFIQTLCEVLREFAHVWNLMDMLLEVNNKIAFKQGRLDETTIAKQMSNLCDNTLRKQLHFLPQIRNSCHHC